MDKWDRIEKKNFNKQNALKSKILKPFKWLLEIMVKHKHNLYILCKSMRSFFIIPIKSIRSPHVIILWQNFGYYKAKET